MSSVITREPEGSARGQERGGSQGLERDPACAVEKIRSFQVEGGHVDSQGQTRRLCVKLRIQIGWQPGDTLKTLLPQ